MSSCIHLLEYLPSSLGGNLVAVVYAATPATVHLAHSHIAASASSSASSSSSSTALVATSGNNNNHHPASSSFPSTADALENLTCSPVLSGGGIVDLRAPQLPFSTDTTAPALSSLWKTTGPRGRRCCCLVALSANFDVHVLTCSLDGANILVVFKHEMSAMSKWLGSRSEATPPVLSSALPAAGARAAAAAAAEKKGASSSSTSTTPRNSNNTEGDDHQHQQQEVDRQHEALKSLHNSDDLARLRAPRPALSWISPQTGALFFTPSVPRSGHCPEDRIFWFPFSCVRRPSLVQKEKMRKLPSAFDAPVLYFSVSEDTETWGGNEQVRFCVVAGLSAKHQVRLWAVPMLEPAALERAESLAEGSPAVPPVVVLGELSLAPILMHGAGSRFNYALCPPSLINQSSGSPFSQFERRYFFAAPQVGSPTSTMMGSGANANAGAAARGSAFVGQTPAVVSSGGGSSNSNGSTLRTTSHAERWIRSVCSTYATKFASADDLRKLLAGCFSQSNSAHSDLFISSLAHGLGPLCFMRVKKSSRGAAVTRELTSAAFSHAAENADDPVVATWGTAVNLSQFAGIGLAVATETGIVVIEAKNAVAAAAGSAPASAAVVYRYSLGGGLPLPHCLGLPVALPEWANQRLVAQRCDDINRGFDHGLVAATVTGDKKSSAGSTAPPPARRLIFVVARSSEQTRQDTHSSNVWRLVPLCADSEVHDALGVLKPFVGFPSAHAVSRTATSPLQRIIAPPLESLSSHEQQIVFVHAFDSFFDRHQQQQQQQKKQQQNKQQQQQQLVLPSNCRVAASPASEAHPRMNAETGSVERPMHAAYVFLGRDLKLRRTGEAAAPHCVIFVAMSAIKVPDFARLGDSSNKQQKQQQQQQQQQSLPPSSEATASTNSFVVFARQMAEVNTGALRAQQERAGLGLSSPAVVVAAGGGAYSLDTTQTAEGVFAAQVDSTFPVNSDMYGKVERAVVDVLEWDSRPFFQYEDSKGDVTLLSVDVVDPLINLGGHGGMVGGGGGATAFDLSSGGSSSQQNVPPGSNFFLSGMPDPRTVFFVVRYSVTEENDDGAMEIGRECCLVLVCTVVTTRQPGEDDTSAQAVASRRRRNARAAKAKQQHGGSSNGGDCGDEEAVKLADGSMLRFSSPEFVAQQRSVSANASDRGAGSSGHHHRHNKSSNNASDDDDDDNGGFNASSSSSASDDAIRFTLKLRRVVNLRDVTVTVTDHVASFRDSPNSSALAAASSSSSSASSSSRNSSPLNNIPGFGGAGSAAPSPNVPREPWRVLDLRAFDASYVLPQINISNEDGAVTVPSDGGSGSSSVAEIPLTRLYASPWQDHFESAVLRGLRACSAVCRVYKNSKSSSSSQQKQQHEQHQPATATHKKWSSDASDAAKANGGTPPPSSPATATASALSGLQFSSRGQQGAGGGAGADASASDEFPASATAMIASSSSPSSATSLRPPRGAHLHFHQLFNYTVRNPAVVSTLPGTLVVAWSASAKTLYPMLVVHSRETGLCSAIPMLLRHSGTSTATLADGSSSRVGFLSEYEAATVGSTLNSSAFLNSDAALIAAAAASGKKDRQLPPQVSLCAPSMFSASESVGNSLTGTTALTDAVIIPEALGDRSFCVVVAARDKLCCVAFWGFSSLDSDAADGSGTMSGSFSVGGGGPAHTQPSKMFVPEHVRSQYNRFVSSPPEIADLGELRGETEILWTRSANGDDSSSNGGGSGGDDVMQLSSGQSGGGGSSNSSGGGGGAGDGPPVLFVVALMCSGAVRCISLSSGAALWQLGTGASLPMIVRAESAAALCGSNVCTLPDVVDFCGLSDAPSKSHWVLARVGTLFPSLHWRPEPSSSIFFSWLSWLQWIATGFAVRQRRHGLRDPPQISEKQRQLQLRQIELMEMHQQQQFLHTEQLRKKQRARQMMAHQRSNSGQAAAAKPAAKQQQEKKLDFLDAMFAEAQVEVMEKQRKSDAEEDREWELNFQKQQRELEDQIQELRKEQAQLMGVSSSIAGGGDDAAATSAAAVDPSSLSGAAAAIAAAPATSHFSATASMFDRRMESLFDNDGEDDDDEEEDSLFGGGGAAASSFLSGGGKKKKSNNNNNIDDEDGAGAADGKDKKKKKPIRVHYFTSDSLSRALKSNQKYLLRGLVSTLRVAAETVSVSRSVVSQCRGMKDDAHMYMPMRAGQQNQSMGGVNIISNRILQNELIDGGEHVKQTRFVVVPVAMAAILATMNLPLTALTVAETCYPSKLFAANMFSVDGTRALRRKLAKRTFTGGASSSGGSSASPSSNPAAAMHRSFRKNNSNNKHHHHHDPNNAEDVDGDDDDEQQQQQENLNMNSAFAKINSLITDGASSQLKQLLAASPSIGTENYQSFLFCLATIVFWLEHNARREEAVSLANHIIKLLHADPPRGEIRLKSEMQKQQQQHQQQMNADSNTLQLDDALSVMLLLAIPSNLASGVGLFNNPYNCWARGSSLHAKFQDAGIAHSNVSEEDAAKQILHEAMSMNGVGHLWSVLLHDSDDDDDDDEEHDGGGKKKSGDAAAAAAAKKKAQEGGGKAAASGFNFEKAFAAQRHLATQQQNRLVLRFKENVRCAFGETVVGVVDSLVKKIDEEEQQAQEKTFAKQRQQIASPDEHAITGAASFAATLRDFAKCGKAFGGSRNNSTASPASAVAAAMNIDHRLTDELLTLDGKYREAHETAKKREAEVLKELDLKRQENNGGGGGGDESTAVHAVSHEDAAAAYRKTMGGGSDDDGDAGVAIGGSRFEIKMIDDNDNSNNNTASGGTAAAAATGGSFSPADSMSATDFQAAADPQKQQQQHQQRVASGVDDADYGVPSAFGAAPSVYGGSSAPSLFGDPNAPIGGSSSATSGRRSSQHQPSLFESFGISEDRAKEISSSSSGGGGGPSLFGDTGNNVPIGVGGRTAAAGGHSNQSLFNNDSFDNEPSPPDFGGGPGFSPSSNPPPPSSSAALFGNPNPGPIATATKPAAAAAAAAPKNDSFGSANNNNNNTNTTSNSDFLTNNTSVAGKKPVTSLVDTVNYDLSDWDLAARMRDKLPASNTTKAGDDESSESSNDDAAGGSSSSKKNNKHHLTPIAPFVVTAAEQQLVSGNATKVLQAGERLCNGSDMGENSKMMQLLLVARVLALASGTKIETVGSPSAAASAPARPMDVVRVAALLNSSALPPSILLLLSEKLLPLVVDSKCGTAGQHLLSMLRLMLDLQSESGKLSPEEATQRKIRADQLVGSVDGLSGGDFEDKLVDAFEGHLVVCVDSLKVAQAATATKCFECLSLYEKQCVCRS